MKHNIGDLVYDEIKQRIGWIVGKENGPPPPLMERWIIEWSDGLNSTNTKTTIEYYKKSLKRKIK